MISTIASLPLEAQSLRRDVEIPTTATRLPLCKTPRIKADPVTAINRQRRRYCCSGKFRGSCWSAEFGHEETVVDIFRGTFERRYLLAKRSFERRLRSVRFCPSERSRARMPQPLEGGLKR
jgi:hypothetical protein